MYVQLIALAIGNRIFLAILALVLAPISVGATALFHPTNAAVSTDASTIHARFRLGMQGQPEFIDVDLMVLAGLIRCTSTKTAVSAKRLAVLDIPFDGPR